MVGGLSDAIGYGIGDRAMPFMDAFAQKQFGVSVHSVERTFITYADGRNDEVNLLLEGERKGEKVWLVGECKSRPGLRDLSRLDKMLKRLAAHFAAPVSGFIVGYSFAPAVLDALAKDYRHIGHFQTYQIERIATR